MAQVTKDGVTTGKRDPEPGSPEEAAALKEAAAKAERERAVRFELDQIEKEKLAAQGGRTEEEMNTMAPVKIRLGDDSYEIPIQPWAFEKVWNRRYAEFLKRANDHQNAVLNKNNEFGTTNKDIDSTLWLLEEMIDLFFAYWVPADDVRKKIEGACSRKELQKAAEKVINIVSPLA